MKRCICCHEEKPAEAFRSPGTRLCRRCKGKADQERIKQKRHANARKCHACQEVKPIECFGMRRNGRAWVCVDCERPSDAPPLTFGPRYAAGWLATIGGGWEQPRRLNVTAEFAAMQTVSVRRE